MSYDVETVGTTIETQSDKELLAEVKVASTAEPTKEEIEAGGVKFIEAQVKALGGGVRLQTRNLLNMLSRHGIDEATKRQVRETIERAILAALDYGVDVYGKPMEIRENGRLGKLEIEYAGTMSKLKETGMLLMAKKYEKSNFGLDDYQKGATINEETKVTEVTT